MTNFTKILCIDIGGTYTKYGFVDRNNLKKIDSRRIPTLKGKKFPIFLKSIIAQYEDFECIAIGFSGIVLNKHTIYSENLDLGKFDLNSLKLNKPLFVANDAFCNPLSHLNELKNESAIFLVIGTSSALAYVNKGQIMTGQNNIFGEIADVNFELGVKFLKEVGEKDFSFLRNPKSNNYEKYFNRVIKLIELLSAIFAPNKIFFDGGIIIHEWDREFKKRVNEATKKTFILYRPKLILRTKKHYGNLLNTSLLPEYLMKKDER